MVEMEGVEPSSESISTGLSPSASDDLHSPLNQSISRLIEKLSRRSSEVPGTPPKVSCMVDARSSAYR